MYCPVCGNIMEKGFLQTQQRASWVKKKHLFSILPKEGEVLLGNNVFSSLVLDAYICKLCKKVVIDYSQAAHEEG